MNYELGTLILGFLGFFQFDIMKLQFTTLEFGHSDIHLNFFFFFPIIPFTIHPLQPYMFPIDT